MTFTLGQSGQLGSSGRGMPKIFTPSFGSLHFHVVFDSEPNQQDNIMQQQQQQQVLVTIHPRPMWTRVCLFGPHKGEFC